MGGIVIRVGLDVAGGDCDDSGISHLERAVKALAKVSLEYERQDVIFVAIGPEREIRKELSKYTHGTNIEHVDHDKVFDMGGRIEDYRNTDRSRIETTISIGAQLLAENKIKVLGSDGNTTATVGYVVEECGMLAPRIRYCLATKMPKNVDKFYYLCDAGANKKAKPIHLKYNALLAKLYLEHVLGIKDPRIGLLQGTLSSEAHQYLKEIDKYIPIITPSDIYENKFDLVVSDGFEGNVALKATEASAHCTMDRLKREGKVRLFFFRDKLLSPYFAPNGQLDKLKTLGRETYRLVGLDEATTEYVQMTFEEILPEEGKINIGVLSNGEEDAKGNKFAQDLAAILKTHENSGYSYKGFVEPEHILRGFVKRGQEEYPIDAVFTQATTARLFADTVAASEKQFLNIVSPLITQKNMVFRREHLKKEYTKLKEGPLNANNYNYAPVLGVNGLIVVGHGKANAYGVEQLLRFEVQLARSGFLEYCKENLQKILV